MAFLYFPAEAKSLIRTIYKFQRVTDNKKASRIESTLQKLINRVAATEPLGLPLLVSKKKQEQQYLLPLIFTTFSSSQTQISSLKQLPISRKS